MMRASRYAFALIFAISVFVTGCSKKDEPKTNSTTTTTTSSTSNSTDDKTKKQPTGDVLTQDKQKSLTPDAVIQGLKDGNKRFADGKLTDRDYSKQVHATSTGQYPEAVVLSCLDSRVPVETVFDKGIGDVFVARVAGNIANPDILASMEYGCKVVGAKVILVLGHSHCGAVKSSIDDVKLGNITQLLEKISPSVKKFSDYKGEKNSKNDEFVDMVAKENVRETIEHIRKDSPILKEMEDKGEIKIVGANYDIDNGKVEFLDK